MTRELAQSRPNWNLYVGDPQFKSNFSLEFFHSQTAKAFTSSKLLSALYSFRCLVIIMFFYLCQLNRSHASDLTFKLAGPNLDMVNHNV